MQMQGLQIAGKSQSNNYKARVNPRKKRYYGAGNCNKVIDRQLLGAKRIIRSHVCIIILGSETKYKPTSQDVQDIVLPTRKCALVGEFGDSETKELVIALTNRNISVTPRNFELQPSFIFDCIAKQSKNKTNKNKTIYNQNLFFGLNFRNPKLFFGS